MTLRVAVAAPKGGTGKSTTAINLGGALSERGLDVLLVDADPQANATEGLGQQDAYDAPAPNLFHVLADAEQRDAIRDLIIEGEKIDLVPGNIDMSAIEHELTVARRAGERLSMALDLVDDRYDVVVVDCPPSLGNMTDNALIYARDAVVPLLAESTSKRALELLQEYMLSLERDFEIEIEELAIVANRVEETTEADSMMEWFGTAAATDGIPVIEIRKRVALQRAFAAGGSILAHEEECDMAERYRELADVVVERGRDE